LKNDLSEAHKIHHIDGEPKFVSSEVSELIQTSDAVGYCTLKHLSDTKKFDKYWNQIEPKHYHKNGQIYAYGLNIFPKEDWMA